MRLSIFTAIVHLTTSVLAFNPQTILWLIGLRQSNIPEFLHHSNHDWIEENRWTLEGMNATDAICNVDSPLRAHLSAIPGDFFRHIIVSSIDSPVRSGPETFLRSIRECPAALDSCESLFVSMDLDSDSHARAPSKVVTDLFADITTAMPSLRKIEWSTDGLYRGKQQLGGFEAAFRQVNLTLPQVTDLVLAPWTQFLVDIAPNMESVSTTDKMYAWPGRQRLPDRHDAPRLALIKSLEGAKRLKDFRLEASWTTKLVQAVLDAVPDIETLGILGDINSDEFLDKASRCSEDSTTTLRLKALASGVAQFKELTHLHLPAPVALDAGYMSDMMMCGNGLSDDPKSRRVELREYMYETETAIKPFLDNLPPNILSLTTGSYDAINPRNRTAEGKQIWPWTGRMKEYILEEIPRCTNESARWCGDVEDPDGPVFNTWSQDEKMLDEDWVYVDSLEYDWEEGWIGDGGVGMV